MRALLFLALMLAPAAALAAPAREMVEIEAGQPVTIRADRAYILFRSIRPKGAASIEPVFLRVPTTQELEQFRAARREAFRRAEPELMRRYRRELEKRPDRAGPPPSEENFAFVPEGPHNLQNIEDGSPFVKGSTERVYLVEVLPGDYVLYGATFGAGILKDALHACMCLGTVGFPAEAGEVTDLGYFFADMVHRESPIPELRVESGFGPSSNAYIAPIGATVRPADGATPVPQGLERARVRPARYRAVGKFFDPRAMTVNRLVPVPGVLAYDGGRVIDVESGKEAEGGHF